MCNLDNIQAFNNQNQQQLFPFLVGTHRYFIPLLFNLNIEDEMKKIDTKINYLTGFLNSIEQKISNKNFTKNAPKKVVEMELKKKSD